MTNSEIVYPKRKCSDRMVIQAGTVKVLYRKLKGMTDPVMNDLSVPLLGNRF